MANFNLKSYFTFLSRNKAYTAVNVFGLAVSLAFVILIGLYTWQETSVDRQHSKADRIYNLGIVSTRGGQPMAYCPHGVLRYIRKRYPEVVRTCGVSAGEIKLKKQDFFITAHTLMTDSTFFDMFDFPLLRGNRATCLKEKNNIVITESFAMRYFGTTDVVGRDIKTAYGYRFRVTGVVADFDNTIIDKDIDVLIDFSYQTNAYAMDEYFPYYINYTATSSFVEVSEGCDFSKQGNSVREMFKDVMKDWRINLTRLDKLYFSNQWVNNNLDLGNPTLVKILFAVGIVILLFSIMNYVNLTVAQSGYRAREMATRRLFGCNKAGVAANMFMESLVMCAVSAALAAALVYALAPHAGRLLGTKLNLALLLQPSVIAVIIVFAVLVSAIAGVLPAVTLSKVKPIEVVRGTFRKQTKMIFSRVFITAQNVITIIMLACALIMSLQMKHLTDAPLGFNKDNMIDIWLVGNTEESKQDMFINKLRALPFVKNAAFANGTPANGGNNHTVTFAGEKQPWSFQLINSTKEFMDIFGITLKYDRHIQGDSIIYLNDMAMKALKMKPTDTHMNDRYKNARYEYFAENAQFGGIINDIQVRNITNGMQPVIIQICKKVKSPWEIVIQVEGNQEEAYKKIKDIYREVFHEDVYEKWTPFIDKQTEKIFQNELRSSKIVSLFAFIAIVISLLGLVAMSTYFIQQRAREIAVRKVFGSTGGQVRRRLIRTFLAYVGIAFVIAAPITAYFINGWITQYSYRIVWWPYIILAGAIVLAISYAAVAVQSRMAASENPVKNIKQE